MLPISSLHLLLECVGIIFQKTCEQDGKTNYKVKYFDVKENDYEKVDLEKNDTKEMKLIEYNTIMKVRENVVESNDVY